MKAILMSIRPEYTGPILDGSKQYEFRGNNVKNFEVDQKIYIYESLGKKRYQWTCELLKTDTSKYDKFMEIHNDKDTYSFEFIMEYCDEMPNYEYSCSKKGKHNYDEFNPEDYCDYCHIGLGKVVGEAVIEDIIKIPKLGCGEDSDCSECNLRSGYADCDATVETFKTIQQYPQEQWLGREYAIKLKDVKRYDVPKELSEFTSYGKLEKARVEINKNYQDSNLENVEELLYWHEIQDIKELSKIDNLQVIKPPQSFLYCVKIN